MKVLNKARLDALERALKSKDGVLVVEQVEGGYELPSGEIVKDLAPLHKRYAVIIVDDVDYRHLPTRKNGRTLSVFVRKKTDD